MERTLNLFSPSSFSNVEENSKYWVPYADKAVNMAAGIAILKHMYSSNPNMLSKQIYDGVMARIKYRLIYGKDKSTGSLALEVTNLNQFKENTISTAKEVGLYYLLGRLVQKDPERCPALPATPKYYLGPIRNTCPVRPLYLQDTKMPAYTFEPSLLSNFFTQTPMFMISGYYTNLISKTLYSGISKCLGTPKIVEPIIDFTNPYYDPELEQKNLSSYLPNLGVIASQTSKMALAYYCNQDKFKEGLAAGLGLQAFLGITIESLTALLSLKSADHYVNGPSNLEKDWSIAHNPNVNQKGFLAAQGLEIAPLALSKMVPELSHGPLGENLSFMAGYETSYNAYQLFNRGLVQLLPNSLQGPTNKALTVAKVSVLGGTLYQSGFFGWVGSKVLETVYNPGVGTVILVDKALNIAAENIKDNKPLHNIAWISSKALQGYSIYAGLKAMYDHPYIATTALVIGALGLSILISHDSQENVEEKQAQSAKSEDAEKEVMATLANKNSVSSGT